MHYTRALSLLAFITTIALQMGLAAADCCPCNGGRCNDRTKCTPYCGYRPCNIFGCNCGGGCRHAGFQGFLIQSDLEDSSEIYFDDADANKDGKLTFDEWAATDQNKGHDKDVLHKQWAKYDHAGVGHLTKTQAIFRTA